MKIRYLAALLTVMASGHAVAGPCSSLGTIAQPGLAVFGNAFSSPQPFNDCYTFSLAGSGDVSGLTFTWDFSSLNISLNSISLTGNGVSATDPSPENFGVSGLAPGFYQLNVAGVVTGSVSQWGWTVPVSYTGTLFAERGSRSVPEPGTLGMFGLALVGLAFALRRKQFG